MFDYVPGKDDWSAAGRPLEGATADAATAGSAADPSVPKCALGDDLQDVRVRVRATDWLQCIVLALVGTLRRHWRLISVTSGTLLVVFGVLLATGELVRLTTRLARFSGLSL